MKKIIKQHKIIMFVVIIFIIAAIISATMIQFIVVHGDSMNPTLKDKQILVINKLDHNYKREDVIVFSCCKLDNTLIKRIVGCPGDYVSYFDGKLYINNLGYKDIGDINDRDIRDTLEKGIYLSETQYFVLGDNLSVSVDSRDSRVGIVEKKQIIGRVMVW